jgi:hypothetical protein
MHYAISERAALRIVLAEDEPADAFQDQLHLALLETVRTHGTRPADIEVLSSSVVWVPVG